MEGREREGPQVTVEPGPLRALLRDCRDYSYVGNAAENLRSNAATSVLRRHVDILQVDCSTYERRVGPVVHAVCHQLPTSMTHSSSYQLTALTHYCYHQGCGSRDLVLVSRPIKTTFLRSWSRPCWSWSRPVWSWSRRVVLSKT